MGACNFFGRHIHNFTYSSAPRTDLIKETTPWRWTARDEECFQELKNKIASSNCLGVPRPKGGIVLITDASDVEGGGTIYQWQELNPAELTHCHYRTSGLNSDGTLKHDYPTSECPLVPLGHWNWKWNQARSNYSTYDQEHLAGMLVLSSQSRLLGSHPVVWLCDPEPVRSFQKGPPPEKAKLKRWWTYLSQFRPTVHHIPGIKNEPSDYISLPKRVRRVGIGHTCGYLHVEVIQHSFVPPSVTTDAYILIRVHLPRCPIGVEPLFDQHFHSLLTCDFLIAREHTCEARQATGDH